MSEKLKEMPERVYVYRSGAGYLNINNRPPDQCTEYIRADLAKSPSPQLPELREKVEAKIRPFRPAGELQQYNLGELRACEWFLAILTELEKEK